jgi:putative SbcD/Mre11-related phosphoesterase
MDKSRYFISPDIWLDHRRAAWFPDQSILAVADLHLGYTWAHRHSGQLMPIHVEDDAVTRLAQLVSEYKPRETILLGDLVHAVFPIPKIETELRKLCDALCGVTELILVLGNHDRNLSRLSHALSPGLRPRVEHTVANRLFVHGDALPNALGNFIVMGHEHPAISLGDGVATSQKFPCFLRSERVLVLPAFSQWSAGSNIREGFMSPLANNARFVEAIAILGNKLLPVRLS